jgi:hypothetical protein
MRDKRAPDPLLGASQTGWTIERSGALGESGRSQHRRRLRCRTPYERLRRAVGPAPPRRWGAAERAVGPRFHDRWGLGAGSIDAAEIVLKRSRAVRIWTEALSPITGHQTGWRARRGVAVSAGGGRGSCNESLARGRVTTDAALRSGERGVPACTRPRLACRATCGSGFEVVTPHQTVGSIPAALDRQRAGRPRRVGSPVPSPARRAQARGSSGPIPDR